MKNEISLSQVLNTNLSGDESDANWKATETAGVMARRLSPGSPNFFETSILRLAPGASLPVFNSRWGIEVFVLDGEWTLPEGSLKVGGYSRRPATYVGENSTKTGCTLLLRTGLFSELDTELTQLQSTDEPWLPGQGGLTVKPLQSFEGENTALVHWPAGERFVPHQHWGGEEIFVLLGTFEDEHGRYPKGTWIRSPHLSTHFPFVQEETIILVKTGHMHPANFIE